MHADVTVLTTRGVTLARGVGGDCVERAEVATDTANLLLKDLVVEAGLEFALSRRGGCDIHGGLTTAEDDVLLLGGDGGAVEGCVGDVRLEDFELLGCDELEVFLMLVKNVLLRISHTQDKKHYLGTLVF